MTEIKRPSDQVIKRSGEVQRTPEDQAWLDMPPVGAEFGSEEWSIVERGAIANDREYGVARRYVDMVASRSPTEMSAFAEELRKLCEVYDANR